ncbi:hypothetical protein GCM10010405_02590 [Streptomyces macrosporus]|uniref:Uncharacterized protein n=1 Tax=Streptomyces macrosporus TaxID=44032 RepID=A0ABN3J734_9ACTN
MELRSAQWYADGGRAAPVHRTEARRGARGGAVTGRPRNAVAGAGPAFLPGARGSGVSREAR